MHAGPFRAGVVSLGLAIVGGTLVGCGSTDVATIRSSGPITKAEATAFARAINLGARDVPGMVSTSLEGEHKEESLDEVNCGPRQSHAHLVNIDSPTFRSGEGFQTAQARSSVEVVSTT